MLRYGLFNYRFLFGFCIAACGVFGVVDAAGKTPENGRYRINCCCGAGNRRDSLHLLAGRQAALSHLFPNLDECKVEQLCKVRCFKVFTLTYIRQLSLVRRNDMVVI